MNTLADMAAILATDQELVATFGPLSETQWQWVYEIRTQVQARLPNAKQIKRYDQTRRWMRQRDNPF